MTDFDAVAGSDRLDLTDLLEGENSSNLTDYSHFTFDGMNTTVEVKSHGAGGAVDQKIVLTGVNLTSLGTDSDIISTLLANGKLTTDENPEIVSGFSHVPLVLPPWHANIGKRQVKAPKVYVRDTGLLHNLLDIRDRHDLDRNPKAGSSWEGFALRQVIARLGAAPEECYFWAIHSGAELDLLWVRGRRRWGFEFKRTSSPSLTRSLMTALDSLQLDKAFLIHAGDKTFPLHRRISAVAAARLLDDLSQPAR